MFKDALKRKPYYWVFVSITALLSYGFTLTNFSVGVDDELIDAYANGGLAAQGRFGTFITKFIFDSYDFYPFWRDFLGVILIVLGITLFAKLIMEYSNGMCDEKAVTIFSCVAISFPYIAESFIFSGTTIEMGLVMILTVVSLNYGLKYGLKRNILSFVISTLSLTYAISFSEMACFYFLSASSMCLLLTILFSPQFSQYKFKKVLNIGLNLLTILITSLVLWKFIGSLIQLITGSSNYVNGYIVYDTKNLIYSILVFCFGFVKYFFVYKNVSILLIALSILVVVLFSAYYSIKKKSLLYSLLGLSVVISSLGLHFITGNLSIPPRALVNLCIFVGFAAALLYISLRDIVFAKIKISYLTYFLITLLILNQTKISTDLYFTDYKRYQLDLETIGIIMNDTQKCQPENEQKPVLFVGIPEQYNLKHGWVEGNSILFWDRFDKLDYELDSGRVYTFINMHGYKIARPPEYDLDFVKQQTIEMPSYPHDGYVRDTGKYLIAKLGKSRLEE